MNADVLKIVLFAVLCLLLVQQGAVSESLQNASPVPASGRPHLEEAELPERTLAVRELLEAPSFVPEQEDCFIHIAGGFFSRFNRRYGEVKRCRELLPPCFGGCSGRQGGIRISLAALKYSSPLVYLPKGSIELHTEEGLTLRLEMKVLDYVRVRGQELPCYRLSAIYELDGSCRAVLVCAAIGVEMPVLTGTLYLVSATGDCLGSYNIQIVGRNSVEAENHLLKVVEAVSHF